MKISLPWTNTSGTRKPRHELTNEGITPGDEASGGVEIPASPNGYSGTTEYSGNDYRRLSPVPLVPVTAMYCPADLMAYWVTEVQLREFMIWVRAQGHLDPEITMPEIKEAVADVAHGHGIHIWCSACGAYPVDGHDYLP